MPRVFITCFATLKHWHQRWRQRRDLAQLPPELLRDIGLTGRQAREEAAKWFWQ